MSVFNVFQLHDFSLRSKSHHLAGAGQTCECARSEHSFSGSGKSFRWRVTNIESNWLTLTIKKKHAVILKQQIRQFAKYFFRKLEYCEVGIPYYLTAIMMSSLNLGYRLTVAIKSILLSGIFTTLVLVLWY